MIHTERLVELLEEKLGVTEYIGVPCSNLKYIINEATNKGKYIEAPNEGEAVAYSVGSYLAGKTVAVMMQNSGLANAMNVITSLSCIYKVPHIFLIGYRGMHGKGTDEPQHEVMGEVTEKWLHDCGFETYRASEYTDALSMLLDIELGKLNNPIAILFDKKDCSKVDIEKFTWNKGISRGEVLSIVDEYRNKDTAVIATTGFTGRDLYDHHKNDNNFYMVGSMGCALSLGCGVARNKPDKKVIVLDGDGAVMMRPQGGILAHNFKLDNLLQIILDNGAYESTGHQQVPGNLKYDIFKMEEGIRYDETVLEVTDPDMIRTVVDAFINGITPVRVLIVKINTDKNNNELGRPKETSYELSRIFMKALSE